jgi:hypothetical protein
VSEYVHDADVVTAAIRAIAGRMCCCCATDGTCLPCRCRAEEIAWWRSHRATRVRMGMPTDLCDRELARRQAAVS